MTHSLTEPGSDTYRSFMARFPSGVAVVTALDPEGNPWGMTCSSVCSVTLRPPTLLVCLRGGSPTLGAVIARGSFAINLLSGHARWVAHLFASGSPDRFSKVTWRADAGAGGPHLVADAHATADCRVSRTDPVGDHVVVFGQVTRIWQQPGADPLVYGLHQYAAWAWPEI